MKKYHLIPEDELERMKVYCRTDADEALNNVINEIQQSYPSLEPSEAIKQLGGDRELDVEKIVTVLKEYCGMTGSSKRLVVWINDNDDKEEESKFGLHIYDEFPKAIKQAFEEGRLWK